MSIYLENNVILFPSPPRRTINENCPLDVDQAIFKGGDYMRHMLCIFFLMIKETKKSFWKTQDEKESRWIFFIPVTSGCDSGSFLPQGSTGFRSLHSSLLGTYFLHNCVCDLWNTD
jgi:hypothetical protein